MQAIEGDGARELGECKERVGHTRKFKLHVKENENTEVTLDSENGDISVDCKPWRCCGEKTGCLNLR